MKIFSLKTLSRMAERRPDGYLEDVLSHGRVEGEFLHLDDDAYKSLSEKYANSDPRKVSVPPGPGTELKRLLARIGIHSSPNCSCNKRAAFMDSAEAKEPGWCEKNIDKIIGWLREEAEKRKLPFFDAAGRVLVRRAIRAARKKKEAKDAR